MRRTTAPATELTIERDVMRKQFRINAAFLAACVLGACLAGGPWRALALMGYGWFASGGLKFLRGIEGLNAEIEARQRKV